MIRCLVATARTLVFAGLLLSAVLDSAWGQPADAETRGGNIFLPAPRDYTQRLSRAKKAIADERFSDAVSELGELLRELDTQANGAARADGFESQDYFMGSRGEGGTYVSLKSEAQRMLGAMPAKGREWYELQYGALARKLVDEGVNTGDASKLSDASRLYFHTKAGYEATMLLGRNHLDHGRPLAAALCFKRVAEAPAAALEFEPELSMLLATCWLYSNMPDKVDASLASLEKASPRNPLKVAGRDVDLGTNKQQLLKWLEQTVGRRQTLTGPEETQWALFRGNATRTGLAAGGLVLPAPRWKIPTLNDPSDEDLVRKAAKSLASSGNAILPSIQTLVVDDMVLMRGPERLIAVDFRSGKRISVYPTEDTVSSQTIANRPTGPVPNTRATELQQRIWEDTPYGQISSDGNYVYLLGELGAVSANPNHQFIVMRGGNLAANRGFPKPHNQLVALEIKTELKIKWFVGDADGLDDPRLAGAFFLGPPLPLQGQLYTLAEFNGEIRLVVLNAKNGQLVWQQQLAHMDNMTVLADGGRRLAGASPSFADGVLVCPTSGGAVVAVDISTRRLLWGYQYGKQMSDPRFNGFRFGGMSVQQRPVGARWTDATATISDGRVIVTPPESDELYCLDLLTGKLLWPARKREDALYIGGIHEGKLILVGKNRVQAIVIADGKTAWESPITLPNGAMVTGRGIQSEHFYYVPTSTSEIVKLNLNTAKIEGSSKLDEVPGNLISYKDEVISQSAQTLSTHLMIDPLRKKVAALLDKNKEDAVALARLGEIELHDGRRTESLLALRKAIALDSSNDAIRAILVKTMLVSLRDDFAKNRELAKEVEQLIDQPSQRIEFFRLMAAGLQKAGELDAAFGMYAKLIEASPAIDTSRDANVRLEQLEANHAVRLDRWVMAQLSELYSSASSDQRQKMDETIEAQLQMALAENGPGMLRQFVRHFEFHRVADGARLALGQRLRESDDLLEAEQELGRLEKHADKSIAGRAHFQLARLYAQAKQMDLVPIYYGQLKERFADVECDSGRTGSKCFTDAQEDPELKSLLAGSSQWAYGRTEVKDIATPTTPRFQNQSMLSAINVRQVTGPVAPGTNVVWDAQRNQSIVVRNGLGKEVASISLARIDPRGHVNYYNQMLQQARIHGHLVVAQSGTEVIAVNTLRTAKRAGDTILWREDLNSPSNDPNDPFGRTSYGTQQRTLPFGLIRITPAGPNGNRNGMLGPITNTGVVVHRMREVICADFQSGQPVWTRGNVDAGSDVWGDNEQIYVVPPGGKEALVLSALDGRVLGRRPVPVQDQRLATHGRFVLVGSDQGSKMTLSLLDPWAEKEVFTKNYTPGSKGVAVGSDEFAVLQPDGEFTLLSMDSGELIAKSNLEAESGLEMIRVLRSQGQYILITSRQTTGATSSVVGFNAPIFQRIGQGRVYAFDRETGKTQWKSPVEIKEVALPIDQPTEVPVVLFLGGSVARSPGRSVNGSSLVLCLDKRDGRELCRKDSNNSGANWVYEMEGNPNRKAVRVSLQTRSYELQLTNDPIPPAEPAAPAAPATPPTPATPKTSAAPAPGGKLPEAQALQAVQRAIQLAVPLPINARPAPQPVPVAPPELEIELKK